MEVCGTHTMSAFRSGLRSLLPASVRLISGPGCPVCVTPDRFLIQAMALARMPTVTVATFGDLVRVPVADGYSLERARSEGASVEVVYSPADALAMAERFPDRVVVFLGVGFETTAPAVAWTVRQASARGLANYRVLVAHKTMPPAMRALLDDNEVRIDGFLCPGHVSAIVGTHPFEFIPREYGIPCAVAGFEAPDMIEAIAMLLEMIHAGCAEVRNQYRRGVDADGNAQALAVMNEALEPCDAEWRGLGSIPGSGLRIRDAFSEYDAGRAMELPSIPAVAGVSACQCGAVLRGVITPEGCPLFGASCTPAAPQGACMVSSEGACAAHFRYARSIH